MNKNILLIFIASITLLCQSCKEDFQLTSEWKEFTIIYGLLDHNEKDNFIRIQKAFLDENTSALTIAGVADSLYHQNLKVVNLLELDGTTVLKTIPLQRIKASDFQLEKNREENDIFANDPYYLYHTSSVLNNENTYQLKVETKTGNIVTASTPLIGDFDVLSPKSESEINLASSNPFVRWRKAPNAALYSLRLIIYYSEEKNSEPTINKTLLWNVISSSTVRAENLITYNFDIIDDNLNTAANEYNNAFFKHLASNIEPENLVVRNIDSIQYEFSFGSEDISKYNQVISAQQQSVVGSGQAINPYSNVQNGLGLLASRTIAIVERLTLNAETKDSLHCNYLVKDLNFKPGTPNFRCF